MKGPRRCIDYHIIRARNAGELCELVNQQLGHGWEPMGGMVIEDRQDPQQGPTFYQAMAQFTERAPFT